MKAIRKIARMLIAKHFGYIVWSQEFKGMHFCLDYCEAYDWMLQYPEGSAVMVHRRKIVLTN
jgi:hypothetical protein